MACNNVMAIHATCKDAPERTCPSSHAALLQGPAEHHVAIEEELAEGEAGEEGDDEIWDASTESGGSVELSDAEPEQ